MRFTAYDGSCGRPGDVHIRLHLKNQRGLAYLLTAPGDLGMARAYVSGDLDVEGVHPGDPYDALVLLHRHLKFRAAHARRGAADRARPRLVQPQAAAPAAAGDAAALAARRRRPAALDGPRRRGHPPPLRRLQPLLRDGARPVDDLHLRGVPHRGRHARGGAGRQVRPGRPQARPQARHAAARRRLRLGRHGPPRGPRVRRQGARRHALGAAGVVGQGGHRPRGAGRPRRGPPLRLPRRARGRLRRDQLDRAHRAHRRAAVPRLLRLPARQAPPAGPAAQPLHHPPAQPAARRPARSSTATSSPTAS